LNTFLEYYWHFVYFYGAYHKTLPDGMVGKEPRLEVILPITAWSTIIFVVLVLKMSRGNIIMGFVFGGIISSVMCTNWFPMAYGYIHQWSESVTRIEVLWQLCKGGLLGQVSVLIASLCLPSKLYQVVKDHRKKE